MAHAILLGERVRTRVEKHGRVELSDSEAVALARSKAIHAGLLLVLVPTIVSLAPTYALLAMLPLPFAGFWLGAVTEAVVDPVAGGGGVGVCKGIAKTTGLMVFGFVAMIVMINIFA